MVAKFIGTYKPSEDPEWVGPLKRKHEEFKANKEAAKVAKLNSEADAALAARAKEIETLEKGGRCSPGGA